jgi:predicted proteasome-type protease
MHQNLVWLDVVGRLILKYDTVTGSGVQTVERRGLVEAYELEGDVYMMLTTSNAVKVSTALFTILSIQYK